MFELITFASIVQDTVGVVLPPAGDSLAAEVGATVGATVAGFVLAGLSVVNKFVVDLANKALGKFVALPDMVKTVIALVFAQLVAYANVKFGFNLSTDVSALGTTATGLILWLGSMGFHRLWKYVPTPPTQA